MVRFATLALLLMTASVAGAQTPDTTAAARYLPLATGNVWTYATWQDTCPYPTSCPALTGHTQWRVTGDSVVGGQTYAVLHVERFSTTGAPTESSRELVRFDAAAAHGVRRGADGLETSWPATVLTCRLDAPFYHPANCSNSAVAEPESVTFVQEGGGTVEVPTKRYTGQLPWVEYAADIGLIGHGVGEFNAWWEALVYARVGGVEYGTAVVAGEAGPAPAALSLAVGPNPARGRLTLRLGLPAAGTVRLEAYDATGRRVYATDLGTQPAGAGRVGLDTGTWAPGVYVVRVTTAVGQTATARLVRVE